MKNKTLLKSFVRLGVGAVAFSALGFWALSGCSKKASTTSQGGTVSASTTIPTNGSGSIPAGNWSYTLSGQVLHLVSGSTCTVPTGTTTVAVAANGTFSLTTPLPSQLSCGGCTETGSISGTISNNGTMTATESCLTATSGCAAGYCGNTDSGIAGTCTATSCTIPAGETATITLTP
jgi:hypothetical protein